MEDLDLDGSPEGDPEEARESERTQEALESVDPGANPDSISMPGAEKSNHEVEAIAHASTSNQTSARASRDLVDTLPEIFLATTQEQIKALSSDWDQRRHRGMPQKTGVAGETIVVVPPISSLPPHLAPWEFVLANWEEVTKRGLRRSRLPSSLRKDNYWSLAGPFLPVDASAWIITLGIDPGPYRTEEGFTIPLLVAAPEDWIPGLREVSFHGCQGEMLCSKCDGRSMRIPREWWNKWSWGAMAKGALYYTFGDENGGLEE